MSRFIKRDGVRQEEFPWGRLGWRLTPETGAKHLVVMDATLQPGQGHAFHRHPGQEELIIVKEGTVTQFLERESMTMGPMDSVFIAEGVVHATYNDGDVTAHLQVVIGPALGDGTGYGVEDVSEEPAWRSLRT